MCGTTVYVLDAQGNVLSVYEQNGSKDLTQTEVHLYGSSRLGIWDVNRNVEQRGVDVNSDGIIDFKVLGCNCSTQNTAVAMLHTNGEKVQATIDRQAWSGTKNVNVYFVSNGDGSYKFYDGNNPGEAEAKMRAAGMAVTEWDYKTPPASETRKKFFQTSEGKEFKSAITNYLGGFAMVLTAGVSAEIQIGNGVKNFMATKFGKGAFDILGQALTKGSFDKVDWSDVGAQVLFDNPYFRNAVKSLVDYTGKDGFNIKTLNEGLQEFGLRVVLDKAASGLKEGAQKYTLDVIRKVELKSSKDALKPQVQQSEPSHGATGSY